jgi:tetratricopeptide (TPR) repeat protein
MTSVPYQRKTRAEIDQTARRLTVNRKPQEALRMIDQYLSEVDSTDARLLVLKGNILESQGGFVPAKKMYEAAIRIDPNNTQALTDLGEYYAESRRTYGKALECLNKAIRVLHGGGFIDNLEDEYVAACTEKASLLVKLRRPQKALEIIVDGLQKFPTSRLLSDSLQETQESFHKLLSATKPPRQRNTKIWPAKRTASSTTRSRAARR